MYENINILDIIYHKKKELYEETIESCVHSNNKKFISDSIESFAKIDVILDEILSEFYDSQREEEIRKEYYDYETK